MIDQNEPRTSSAHLARLIVAIAALCLIAGAPVRGAERPNILWITCEDISPHIGCYGDQQAITPHIDRLATQGVRLTNAFSICGVCAPSRSCIITGMYPTSIGSQHMRSQAVLPDQIRCFTEYLREAGYYCTNNVKTDYNFRHPKSAWDESSRQAHWRSRKGDQPFFAVFNFTTTHESRVRAKPEAFQKLTARLKPEQRQDVQALQLPPYYPDTPRTRNDWKQYYELITAMDLQVGDVLRELEEDGLADETVVFYYSDHGVGLPRAKRWLYDSGMQVPMIVRWPGQIEPGTTSDRLVSFVDLAPTVLSLAGVEIPSHLQGRAFLGKQEASPRDYIYGARDRMDERYDLIRAVRDKRYKYIRNYEAFKPYAQRISYAEQGPTMQELRRLHAEGGLNAVQELFFRENKTAEELYDLEADPHELNNLSESSQHRKVLERLRAAHLEWAERTIDTGLLPEPILIERAGDRGIYAAARAAEDSMPFAEYRRVASLSSQGAASLSELREALEHQDPVVRYWGVVGLGALGEDAIPALPSLITMLDDASPSVRVAAAAAALSFGEQTNSLRVLREALRHDQDALRVLAANLIDNLGEQARPLLPECRVALEDKNRYVVQVLEHTLDRLSEAE